MAIDDKVTAALKKLRDYCESENYKGWDPYDGLNSKVYRAIPLLKRSAMWRLCVIQGFKRCPVNLRPMLRVPKEHNAKGVGLFLQGYCNLYTAVKAKPALAETFGTLDELKAKINEVAELLISLKSEGYSGACWGYNFDWQCRREFLFPKNLPTVVATSFCATALMSAYDITNERRYLDLALSAADFVVNDLHRTPAKRGFVFSYAPVAGNDTIINASLLASRLLSKAYAYDPRPEWLDLAHKSVEACIDAQREDGSWPYGLKAVTSWCDSFHTGYNLDGLAAFAQATDDAETIESIEKGFKFYIDNFFTEKGEPKYYHDRQYPIDIHCPGQLIVTASRTGRFENVKPLIDKVLEWTLSNMRNHEKGYFYYQLKHTKSSKIPYMRWSNAFMFAALSEYLVAEM
ncbi:MAG: glycoside hydrolase family 88 protein [Muribaculaceae bacterium]|nr:glycoside hydrolase family 88 protein [Muribaculaceae bacterium]